MIKSFKCQQTKRLFETGRDQRWATIRNAALIRLDYLDAAVELKDLMSPPGNRLEPLMGDRTGQHSLRINRQWRICFVWTDDGPIEVEITDYH